MVHLCWPPAATSCISLVYYTAKHHCTQLLSYRHCVSKNGMQKLGEPLYPRSLRLHTSIIGDSLAGQTLTRGQSGLRDHIGDSASILGLSTLVRAPIAWSLM